METIRQTKPFKKLQKDLQADTAAYAASVGRHNKPATCNIASHPTGAGTVMRLFFGATEQMPVRGLSYVTAALNIAKHIPHEQLQIVFVHDLGQTINGIDKQKARSQALKLRDVSRRAIETHLPDAADKTMFAEDVPVDMIAALQPDISDLVHADPDLLTKLSAKGAKHGSDFTMYGAAHIAHQETGALQPIGLTQAEPSAITPDRIVSVGCQQEHLFYDLRTKAREALTGVDFLPTSQIFTKHVLPPYYSARDGEQSLDDALANGLDLSLTHDLSARRDVTHLLTQIPQEEIRL